MTNEDYPAEEPVDDIEGKPESLLEDDALDNREEAFLEGYESDEEESDKEEEEEDLEI